MLGRYEEAKEIIEQVDATCTSDGYVKYINKDGEEITETIRATGHEYEYQGIVEPSYTGYGHSVYRCVNCGIERYEDFTEMTSDCGLSLLSPALSAVMSPELNFARRIQQV